MSDPGFDDPMTDDELIDPVEKQTLELLAMIAQQMQQAVQGLQVVAQQLAEVARVSAAERVTEAVGRDGRKMQAVSRIAHGR